MPTFQTHAAVPPPEVPRRKRWTREECVALEAAGLLEVEKFELVDGELISRMGKYRPHVNAVTLMQAWLQEVFGKLFVNVEAPIDVNSADNPLNEPQPDLIVLNRKSTTISSGNVQPADVALLIEVSDSTLNFDLTVKAALYGRAGIVEYWVLDVSGRRLFSHRNPTPSGYASVTIYGKEEPVARLAAAYNEFRPAQAFTE